MTILDYENSEKLLTSSGKFRIKLGLERILKILNLLHNPQDKIKIIHVAGTNGKGSVCAISAEILKQAGYKTALYTSPHLFSYTERFKINGVDISQDDFSKYVSDVETLAVENDIDLSEFEILTAVAYKYFCDNNVEIAVMETGLGGRFDATNVVKNPLVTAITSISIDHKDRLGDTIEKIAFEKGGILKKDCPVAINSDNAGKTVINRIAKEKKCDVLYAKTNVDIKFVNGINYAVFESEQFEFSLWGLHQRQNLSLVLEIIKILKKKGFIISQNALKIALKTVFLPARFQCIKDKKIIIDGSHNNGASLQLRKNLDYYFPNQNFSWIFGCLTTKEYDKVLNNLLREGDELLLVEFNNSLSVNPDILENCIKNKNNINIQKKYKTANTLNYFSSNGYIIITGSFYLIGEIFANKIC